MPSGSGVPPESRASDADRDRVLDVLRAAAGDGRLTADEFNERMEAALSSRTHGELAALTADLAAGPGRPGEAATQAEDTIRIAQHGGSIRRTGRWVVPRRLELRSSWCDVMLDFTDAVMTSPRAPVQAPTLTQPHSFRGLSTWLPARRSPQQVHRGAPPRRSIGRHIRRIMKSKENLQISAANTTEQ
jgi:hypothetical protein